MILVWKVLRASVSGWCTNVESPHSTRQQEFSSSANTTVLQPGTISLKILHSHIPVSTFSSLEMNLCKMCSTGRVWQSFLPPHVHSPTPRHISVPGPSPSKVLCLKPWGVSAEGRHFCFPYAPEAELCWAPGSSRPKAITQTQPWDLFIPSLLLLCKSAILIEAPPPCSLSQLVTSSFLRAEELEQPLPWPTFLLCQPLWCVQTFLSSSHTAALPQGCTSCSFLGTATEFPFESITSSSSTSSDHLHKSHHDLLSHPGRHTMKGHSRLLLALSKKTTMPWIMKTDSISDNTLRVSCARAFHR